MCSEEYLDTDINSLPSPTRRGVGGEAFPCERGIEGGALHISGASPDLYPLLKENSRRNRRKQTIAEELLWDRLRGRQLGFKFRRQHPLLDYIADFFCAEANLIIEVDGGYHSEESQMQLDEYRTERLINVGYRVIRFTNEDVCYNIESVLTKIRTILDEQFNR